MVCLTLVVVGVLGLLVQSAYLEQTDQEQTTVLALTQGLLEERVDEARVLEGYANLNSIPLSPTSEPGYLFEQTVRELGLGVKKITVSVYHADPADPATADESRPHGGKALTLSVSVGEPTP